MGEYLKFTQENIWLEIWPELSLALGAILILGIELFKKPQSSSSICGVFAIVFQIFILILHLFDYLVWHHTFDRESFSGMLSQGIQGDVMRSFFILSSLLVSVLGHQYLKRNNLRSGEFHHLTILATAGLMLLVQSNNFVMLFVSLEAVAICFYTLVAYNKNSSRSLEAGIKYLIFGALSSSLLLFGIVLLYGVSSNPDAWGALYEGSDYQDPLGFKYLGNLIQANPDHLLLKTGVVFIIAGIAFKIGAAPFQIWVPDVYHGSPMPITAFLAVSSKAAGFFVLLNLVNGPFAGMSGFLLPLIGFVASFTILFGNLAACAQQNLKRMLGLSGVAHAGYLLVAVMASMIFAGNSDRAVWVLFFYLFTYLIASFAVFGVMGLAHLNNESDQDFSTYQDLGKKHPWLGLVLVSGISSLAGIPPFAGFIGKLLLITVAFEAKLYFSLSVMIVGVAISIYYYFGWIREITFLPKPSFADEDDNSTPDPWANLKPSLLKPFLIALAIASFVLGIWQGPFGDAF